jgi:hypothetical protein
MERIVRGGTSEGRAGREKGGARMTIDEVLDTLSVVRLWWPHSDVDGGDPASAAKAWHAMLEPYDRDEVEAIIRRLSASGREHAPTVGVVASEVERERQGEPPSFDEAQAFIARNVRALPYSATGYHSQADTVEAISALAARGAHEVVLRLVASLGLYAVRHMPDPSLQPLDLNQRATRRDHERAYRHQVVTDWRNDPTPGLALARAERRALRAGDSTLRPLDPRAVLALDRKAEQS